MDYIMLAEIKVKDALREAEEKRVIEAAHRSRKIHRPQRLVRLAGRLGWTRICARVKAMLSPRQAELKVEQSRQFSGKGA